MQEVVIKPSRGWLGLQLRELWAYRELLFFLAWRDIKVRYRQTVFGAAWAIIQPFALMVVFSAIFGSFVNQGRAGGNIPPPIFFYSGLVPWTLFSSALTGSAQSVVGGSNLVTKVYFPRLILPLAATGSNVLDFAIAFIVLVGMMIFYGIVPTAAVVALPLFALLALMTALAVGIGMSALHAKYRDVGYTAPFVTQLVFFLTPVMYPVSSSFIPPAVRPFYALNPMVGVVEGFRWALLGVGQRPGLTLLISSLASMGLLFVALMSFRRLERSFADVI